MENNLAVFSHLYHNKELKLRPYGGKIGVHNSSMDKFLNGLINLGLKAILHDASGSFSILPKRTGLPIRATLSSSKHVSRSRAWPRFPTFP